jgi:hypothetical protein
MASAADEDNMSCGESGEAQNDNASANVMAVHAVSTTSAAVNASAVASAGSATSAASIADAFAASSATASTYVAIAASTATATAAVKQSSVPDKILASCDVVYDEPSVASLSDGMLQRILSTIANELEQQLSDALRAALIKSCSDVILQYAAEYCAGDTFTTIIPELCDVITLVKSVPDSEWLLECEHSQLPRNIVLEHVRPLFVDALRSAHDSVKKMAQPPY